MISYGAIIDVCTNLNTNSSTILV